jgi:hypothetical protein
MKHLSGNLKATTLRTLQKAFKKERESHLECKGERYVPDSGQISQ